jgi:methane/ammonia monooxygenase subunit C
MAQPMVRAEPVEELDDTEPHRKYGPIDWLGGWRTCLVGCTTFLLVAVIIRIWQQFTALEAGLDSASNAFATQYRTLFYAEVAAVTIGTLAWWAYLVRNGRGVVKKEASPGEEVRRIAVFWGLVGTSSVILYIAASFFPNQDGAWHQTLVRDTALTPNHIPMFFLFFPLATTITVGTYLYGRFWIPKVYGAEKGFPWSFFLLISAAVTEMSQVAMNEWGHSLWITEEIFAVPFHWPFVWYGWLAAGIFALWAETIIRLLNIENEIAEPVAPAAEVA